MIQFSKRPFLKTMKQRATEQDIQGTTSGLVWTWTCMGGYTYTFVRMQCIHKHTYTFQDRKKEKKNRDAERFNIVFKKKYLPDSRCFIWTFLNDFNFK